MTDSSYDSAETIRITLNEIKYWPHSAQSLLEAIGGGALMRRWCENLELLILSTRVKSSKTQASIK